MAGGGDPAHSTDHAWSTRTKGRKQHNGKKKRLMIWGKEEERCTAGKVGEQGTRPSGEVQVGTGRISRSGVCRQRTQGRPWQCAGHSPRLQTRLKEGSAELQQTEERRPPHGLQDPAGREAELGAPPTCSEAPGGWLGMAVPHLVSHGSHTWGVGDTHLQRRPHIPSSDFHTHCRRRRWSWAHQSCGSAPER